MEDAGAAANKLGVDAGTRAPALWKLNVLALLAAPPKLNAELEAAPNAGVGLELAAAAPKEKPPPKLGAEDAAGVVAAAAPNAGAPKDGVAAGAPNRGALAGWEAAGVEKEKEKPVAGAEVGVPPKLNAMDVGAPRRHPALVIAARTIRQLRSDPSGLSFQAYSASQAGDRALVTYHRFDPAATDDGVRVLGLI